MILKDAILVVWEWQGRLEKEKREEAPAVQMQFYTELVVAEETPEVSERRSAASNEAKSERVCFMNFILLQAKRT